MKKIKELKRKIKLLEDAKNPKKHNEFSKETWKLLSDTDKKSIDKQIVIFKNELMWKKLKQKRIIDEQICLGLSDVCLKLAKSTKKKEYKTTFQKQAKIFKALSKIHRF